MDCVCVPFRGWMGKTKHLSAFWMGYGSKCQVWVCQELQRCWVLHTQQFPLCIKNGPPPKGHPENLTHLWEALESTWLPVERFRRLVESMPRWIEAVLRAKGGCKLNIRKVFLHSVSVHSVYMDMKDLILDQHSYSQTRCEYEPRLLSIQCHQTYSTQMYTFAAFICNGNKV